MNDRFRLRRKSRPPESDDSSHAIRHNLPDGGSIVVTSSAQDGAAQLSVVNTLTDRGTQRNPEHLRTVPPVGHGRPGLIWGYDKTTDCITQRSVNRSASAPDYYAVNYPDRGRDVELERVFGRLENIAAPLIKWMGALAPGAYELDAATRDAIAGWLALSHARVPAAVDQTFALASFTVAVETDMLLRNPGEYRRRSRSGGATGTDEEIEVQRLHDLEEHKERRLIVEPAPETGLTSLGVAVADIRPVLAGMRWDIFRRGRFPYFVLGDQPITIMRPPNLLRFLGAGFATPGVEVYAPLSPEALLMATHARHDGNLRVLAPDDERRPRSLDHDWNLAANVHAFIGAPHEVFARSQGDLEAVRLAIAPEHRANMPKIRVSSIPKEWRRYLPEGFALDESEAE